MHPAMLMFGAVAAGASLWVVALGCNNNDKPSSEIPSYFAGYAKGVTMPEKLPFNGCQKLPIIIGRSEFRDREVRELLKQCFHDHGNYPELMLPWPEYDPGQQPDCDYESGWCLNKIAFATDKDIVLRGIDEEILLLRVQRVDEKVALYSTRDRTGNFIEYYQTWDAQWIADWNLLVLTIQALEANRAEVERIAAEVAAEREAEKRHLELHEHENGKGKPK